MLSHYKCFGHALPKQMSGKCVSMDDTLILPTNPVKLIIATIWAVVFDGAHLNVKFFFFF